MSEQRDLAQSIAQALGPEWTTRHNDCTDYLVGPDIELHVALESYGNRMLYLGLAATGLAQYRSVRDIIPRIGVNPSRPPASIAKEITRRLLPVLAKLVERRDQAVADESARHTLLGRIADALGVSAPLPDSHHGRNHEMYADLPIGTIHVEATRDTATLKLPGLPAELAIAVCKLLKEASSESR